VTRWQSSPGDAERCDGDVPRHRHVGADDGGRVLRPADLVTAETPIIDVRAHGVVGDGETDDAAAFQAAAHEATPSGVLYVPYDVDLRFESTVDVDLGLSDEAVSSGAGPQTPFALVCDGRLRPGTGATIHVHHGHAPHVSVRVQDGGDRRFAANPPSLGGYSNDAIPDDVDTVPETAVRVSDVRGGTFRGIASGYGGTLFRFDNGRSVTTGVTVELVQTQYTAQPLHLTPGDRSPHDLLGGTEGFGEIRDVWEAPPIVCSEFDSVRGLAINQYENAVDYNLGTKRGVRFEGCQRVTIDKLAVGGLGDVDLVTFRDCRDVQAGSVFCTVIEGSGLVLDSVRDANFDRVFVFRVGSTAVEYAQRGSLETGNNRVVVDSLDSEEAGLLVHESVTGDTHRFEGKLQGNDVHVTSTDASDVRFADVWSDSILHLPAENDVTLVRSRFADVDGTPKAVDGVGRASGSSPTPESSEWEPGNIVAYTRDGSDADGTYLLGPDDTWVKIGEL